MIKTWRVNARRISGDGYHGWAWRINDGNRSRGEYLSWECAVREAIRHNYLPDPSKHDWIYDGVLHAAD